MTVSYSDLKRICVTYLDSLSPINRTRLLNAIYLADGEESEHRQKYLIRQCLNRVYWDIEEAVNMGFHRFADLDFKRKQEAFEYHDANHEQCDSSCPICKLEMIA